ncbi:MAG: translocation/assembly module TamB domain-containing protein [Akkermansiaceae bacterium]|nr:translocation/assembly module TamB domain-containing protein [Armatimonadota bacterium]
MSRPRKPRPPSALKLWQRFVCAAVVAVPPVVLFGRLTYGLLDYLDAILAQSAPLASAFASSALGREVRIGSLTPFLSVREIGRYYRELDKLGTLPVIANDITIANGDTLAGSGELAYIPRLSAFVSVPAILSGNSNTAITKIEVESPRLFLVRRKDGSFNIQELVKKETKPPGPPFLTLITLTDAAIRFEDRATRFPQPQTSDLYPVRANGILGARSLRFDIRAEAKAGTATARRLRGVVRVSGAFAQGKPGSRPDTALPSDPQYTLRTQIPDADIAYFARYLFGNFADFSVSGGRATNATVTFVGPTVAQAVAADARQEKSKKKLEGPNPSIIFVSELSGVRGRVNNVPSPIENVNGDVRYVSAGDLISFDVTGTTFASPIALSGSVWALNAKPNTNAPRLAVRFDAPRIPLSRVLPAFKANLPKGISVGGDATAAGFLTGTPNDLAGSATIAVPRIAVQGATTIQNLSADLAYSKGVLQASRLTAQTDLGGIVSGSGRVRLAETGPGGKAFRLLPEAEISSDFSLQAERVSLPRVAALANATRTARDLALAGTANVIVSGATRGKDVSLTADIATRGLSVAGIAFPVAEARVIVRDNVILTPLARFESPTVGSLHVSGDSSLLTSGTGTNAPISLQFAAHALDAGRIARAFGVADVGGIVNAAGTVTGTLAAPRLNVSRFSAVNPRYQQYSLQSVTGANITATKDAITIPVDSPLVARRFPASVTVSGRVREFLAVSANAKVRPILDLKTRLTNIDYTTIAPFLPKPKDGTAPPPQQFAGTLTAANVRVSGYADAPRLAGNGSLRRVLLGNYPVETGEFQFVFQDGLISIPYATVDASVGTITAKGAITRSGYVYGSFDAPALDLSRVSYLTETVATLGGTLAASGTFSGTRDRPIVTASIKPSDIVVAGTAIKNLSATNIRYIANLEQDVQRIEVPRISLEQEGNTSLLVESGAYDFKRKYFASTVTLRSDSIGNLLTSLRESAFAQTQQGKQALASLANLPTPLDGAFPAERPDGETGGTVATNRVVISGNAGEKGVANYRVRGEIYAQNLRAGLYGADVVRLALDQGSDAAVAPGQPNVGARLEAANVRISDFVAEQVRLTGSLVGETATVASLQIVSGSSTITGSGTAGIGENGQVSALLDSNAVSLDLVRAFVPTLPLSGSLALSVIASGPTKTPNVQASLEGQDILVVSRTAAGEKLPGTEESGTSTTDAPQAKPIRLSLVRAIARIGSDAEGKRFFELSDAQVARDGGGRLEAEARVPFSYSAPYIPPTEPLLVRLRFPSQELIAIRALPFDASTTPETDESGKPQEKATQPSGFTGGNAEGEVTLTGTLREPNLAGLITVKDASYQFKKILKRETLNAISDADATITLAGSKVQVESSVTLARPGGGRGNNGTVTVSGDVTVRELETALSSLNSPPTPAARRRQPVPVAPAFGAGTTLNLLATFTGFEPVESNFLNLNESLRGKIDGQITVTGPVSGPTIATPSDMPLQVQNVRIVPPGQAEQTDSVAIPVPAPPYFNIEIDAPGKNTIAVGGIVSVDVSGTASLDGSLGRPSLRGDFLTQGGALQYFLGRFTLDKGGAVSLNYLGNTGNVEFSSSNPVTARTTAYLRPGASLNAESQTRGGLPIASTQPSIDGRGTRYKITAQLGGRFNFGANVDPANNSFKITPSSDPPLTPSQIYALLVPSSQLASAASGNFEEAGKQLLETALNQGVIPGLFSPIEQRLANSFGLEQFTVDYSPSAPLTVNLLKRLPDPLDRFLVSYTRTLQNNGVRSGGPVPFTAGFLFELYELRVQPNQPIPRISFGLFTNEQQDFTGNLRATIIY